MTKKLIFGLQFLATLLIFYLIVRRWSISLPRLTVHFSDLRWLILSFLLAAGLVQLLAAFRWKIILAFFRLKPSLGELLKINFQSIFWGTFLPSADGFAAFRMLLIERKYPLTPGRAGGSIVVEKLLGMLCLCVLGFFFSFWESSVPNLPHIRFIILILIFIILALGFVIFGRKKVKLIFKPRCQVLKKIISFIRNMRTALQELPLGRLAAAVLPLIIIIQLLTFFNVFLLFKVMSSEVSPMTILALVPIIQLISLLPVTISGLGIREGAFVYFFGWQGISAEIAFAVSLLNFLILNGIPALIGGALSLKKQFQTAG